MNGKHILVTGGAGYIGSHTVVALIEKGFIPVIVDDFRNSEQRMIDGIASITKTEVISYQQDVADYEGLKSIFKKYPFQGIIHFAADKAVGESVGNPLRYYRNNIGSLVTCLELAEEFGVPNFVFSSSCTVYGEPKDGFEVTEETPQQEANSPYGATKQMGERILSDVVKSNKSMKVLNLRYFNPVGAHPSGLIGELPLGKPNNLLPYVTQTGIGKQHELTVFGNDYNTPDGTCVRDYIHVVDLAEAHVKGIEWLQIQADNSLEIINLGTGKGSSVLEIIHTFEKVSGINLNWKFGPRRVGDVEQIFANANRAKELLGWETKKSLEQAVLDAWNWEQQQEND